MTWLILIEMYSNFIKLIERKNDTIFLPQEVGIMTIDDLYIGGNSMYIRNEIIKLLKRMDETDLIFLRRIYIIIKKHIDKK